MNPISNSGPFKDVSYEDYIYIDKTETIYILLRIQKKIFIPVPRRFGKSRQ
ncbi:MAG: AAA family ATPase [Succinivibrio sp.]